jgi:hypothetical protein
VKECAGARLVERWVAPVVRLVGTGHRGGARGWDAGTGRGPEAADDEKLFGGSRTQRRSGLRLCCCDLRGKEGVSGGDQSALLRVGDSSAWTRRRWLHTMLSERSAFNARRS